MLDLVMKVQTFSEHKYYLNLSEDEETSVLDSFRPVLIEHGRFDSADEMAKAIEKFKVDSNS